MVVNPNPRQARAGADKILTNLGQTEYLLPDLVGRLIFPMAAVGQLGGLVPTFESVLENEDVDDDRADGGNYNEIKDGYGTRPYQLEIKGLKYPIPYYKMNEAASIGINWGQRGTQRLSETAQLKLEKQQMGTAGDTSLYESGHTTALDSDSQFGSETANKVAPGVTFRAANAIVRRTIGRDCNVLVIDADAFDKLQEDSTVIDRIKHTGRDSVTEAMIANLYDFDVVVKVTLPNTGMANKALLAYVHPAVVQQWLSGGSQNNLNGGYRVPFRTTGAINRLMPSYGYTYCYEGQPTISPQLWNEENEEYYYKLNFTRSVEHTGVNESNQKITFGHLLTNVASLS